MNKRQLTTLLLTINLLTINTVNVHHQHELNMEKNRVIEQNIKKQNEFVQNMAKEIIKEKEEKARKEAEQREKELERQRQIELAKQKQKEEEAKWIPVRISYYTNDVSDCGKTDAIGASGKNLSRGGNFVASPANIPFGTKIYIEGHGTYEVQDRGGAIKWENGVCKLDVFIPNASQSYLNKLGVKYTKAKIVE